MILRFILSMIVSYILFNLMEKYTNIPNWAQWAIVLLTLFILF